MTIRMFGFEFIAQRQSDPVYVIERLTVEGIPFESPRYLTLLDISSEFLAAIDCLRFGTVDHGIHYEEITRINAARFAIHWRRL
jgi:hypothetical protein